MFSKPKEFYFFSIAGINYQQSEMTIYSQWYLQKFLWFCFANNCMFFLNWKTELIILSKMKRFKSWHLPKEIDGHKTFYITDCVLAFKYATCDIIFLYFNTFNRFTYVNIGVWPKSASRCLSRSIISASCSTVPSHTLCPVLCVTMSRESLLCTLMKTLKLRQETPVW